MRSFARPLGAIAAAALLVLGGGAASAAEDPAAIEAAKTTIWTMEQAIYAGRGKGDISAYADNTAQGYLAWPPILAKPMRVDGFKRAKAPPEMAHEKLEMELLDFTLYGDTAIIYYRTHRTMLADGTPADDRFDVTHTWVQEGGKWRVLGGMARSQVMR
ncbi:nuclear transport factor 2 family protein [Novosphingobium profundi]|uniref:nuclear transport factor 2 family protein n=1 Tax=Novosphingobium profundi TaxID=1774954 RepID=UPI001BDB1AA6|nr:nuclear transport factor 2 family protein [Novosphingobium profundi]MBT0668218.1 nuclear transport factor 2 family protein [Novosphingobium profundi]